MADYPALDQHITTRRRYQYGTRVDRMSNGMARARRFWSTAKSTWEVHHVGLSAAQAQQVLDHQVNWDGNPFSFVSADDGLSYSVIYGEGGIQREPHGANRVTLIVHLEEA